MAIRQPTVERPGQIKSDATTTYVKSTLTFTTAAKVVRSPNSPINAPEPSRHSNEDESRPLLGPQVPASKSRGQKARDFSKKVWTSVKKIKFRMENSDRGNVSGDQTLDQVSISAYLPDLPAGTLLLTLIHALERHNHPQFTRIGSNEEVEGGVSTSA